MIGKALKKENTDSNKMQRDVDREVGVRGYGKKFQKNKGKIKQENVE